MIPLAITGKPQVISGEHSSNFGLSIFFRIPAGQHVYTESNQIVIDRIFRVVPYELFRYSHDRYNIAVAMIDTVERTLHTSSFLSVRVDPSGFSP